MHFIRGKTLKVSCPFFYKNKITNVSLDLYEVLLTMKIKYLLLLFLAVNIQLYAKKVQEKFPDGTPVPAWFNDTSAVDVSTLGKQYIITDYGVKNDSTVVQTSLIQKVIDDASLNGGGVVVIPLGTFLSGSIFCKRGTHLYMEEGAVLKGIDDISHYAIKTTRLEGQTIKYFSALINADSINGFTISGKGTVNGNGLRFWREFWIRREINPNCTNLEAMRPRLVYISNCNDVNISGVHFVNSPFCTTHIYRSERVKLLNLYIYAPTSGVKAPSSDAIDIDACKDVLVHGCYMSVNDDAIALKGGKGTWADKDPNNGPNENIIIENCRYGVVHSTLTLGSESIHNRNIILRRCNVHNADRILWLKMRPDTPQNYEYVLVEDIKGDSKYGLFVYPWTQFFKPEKRDDMPVSECSNITMRNINLDCNVFFNVKSSDKYSLHDFSFENIDVKSKNSTFDKSLIKDIKCKNVIINGQKIQY